MNHSSNNAVAQTDTDSINLESGHLSRLQLTSLAISSMIPAVGMASFPMLLVLNAGLGGWVAALLAALTVICVGRAVTVFASPVCRLRIALLLRRRSIRAMGTVTDRSLVVPRVSGDGRKHFAGHRRVQR